MGTSTDYSAPPNWRNLKGAITRTGGSATVPEKVRELLRAHIVTNGGAKQISSGRGQLGTGRTAKSVGRSLANFVSSVSQSGLDQTLRANGLGELVGRSVTEIFIGIVSLCGGTDGAMDSADARNALSATLDEICKEADSAEKLEKQLAAQMDGDGLGALLFRYFGNYLFEQFCRVFFGQLVKKHGDTLAHAFLQQIRDVIKADLTYRTFGKDLSRVNWFGREGAKIASEVMRDTLAVFE